MVIRIALQCNALEISLLSQNVYKNIFVCEPPAGCPVCPREEVLQALLPIHPCHTIYCVLVAAKVDIQGVWEYKLGRETYFLLCSGGSFMSFCILKEENFETSVHNLKYTFWYPRKRGLWHFSLKETNIWFSFSYKCQPYQIDNHSHHTLITSLGVSI